MLLPHTCLAPHHLSGMPSSHVWNPHLCLVPHPLSGTQSLVWNPIPCLEPHPLSGTHPLSDIPPPVPPPHHLAPVPLPPSGPCCPCLAPNCPHSPDLAPGCPPIWNSYPLPPSSCPPTLSNIIIKGPLHLKRNFGFFWVFKVFRCSFQSHLTSISPCVIISFTMHPKIPKIVVQQPRFHQ